MSSPAQDIVRGAYLCGQRRIDCPVCDGGGERERGTMSLYEREAGGIGGYCYRATCHAYVSVDGVDAVKPAFRPLPMLDPYRTLEEGDLWAVKWKAAWWKGFGDDENPLVYATRAGLRVLKDSPTTCAWQLRSLYGVRIGHITRTVDKRIRTYKEVEGALYYSNPTSRNVDRGLGALFVFEDPMSAAVCKAPAVALLGTKLTADVCKEIKDTGCTNVLVCLDPGAEMDALEVYERLVAAGVRATYVPMTEDYKDMTRSCRYALHEAYV